MIRYHNSFTILPRNAAAFCIGLGLAAAPALADSKRAANADSELPIITLDPREVCSTVTFLNAEGARTVGQKPCQQRQCLKTGDTGCVTTVAIPSADLDSLQPSQMVIGYTLLGITGTFDPNAPVPTACRASGQVNCITHRAYVGLDKRNLTPGTIAKGITIPGIATGDYPSARHRLDDYSGQDIELGGSSLATTLQKQGKVQFWTARGTRQVVSIDQGLKPANIVANKTIHGIRGTMLQDTFPICSKDGQKDCQVKQGFIAVTASKFKPENFRRGIAIGSLVGNYPSASAPLQSVNSTIADITAQNSHALLSQDVTFQYFDRFGKRYTFTGDGNLNPSNIIRSREVFGVQGTFVGQSDDNNIDAFDIRYGATVAGVGGKLDLTCGSKGTCRSDYWQDLSVAANGNRIGCGDSPARCMFRHKITKLTWMLPLRRNYVTWDNARTFCSNENIDGHTDWRLPTQKEALQAMVHGMHALPFHKHYNNQFESSERFWTSSAVDGSNRVYFSPRRKLSKQTQAHNNIAVNVMCVRGGD